MNNGIVLLKTLLLSTSRMNILRHSTDRKKRRRIIGNTIGVLCLYAMLMAYSIAICIGYGQFGMIGAAPVTCALTKMGYDTIGVDLSYPMLEKAREHSEKEDLSVLWIQQDITGLDLYGSVDVFTSFLDTVNHITSRDQLKKCFQKVACFLNPGGLFIFDAATENHFQKTLGQDFFYCIEDDFAVMWENEYLPGKKRNIASLTVFGEGADGKYERADEDIEERFYPDDEIRKLAASCGLEVIAVYGDLKKRKPNEKDERVFYCLRRPMKRK